MAIRTVLTRGYGNGTFNGTIPLAVTRGYTIGVVLLGDPVYCVYYTPISDRVIVLSMPLEDDYEVMNTEITEIVVISTPINDRVEVLSVPLEDDYEVLNTPITC